MSARIKSHLDHLFDTAPDRHQQVRSNPVTGENFMPDIDPIEPHLERAEWAMLARLRFAAHKPYDAPQLPLTHREREYLKGSSALDYVVSLFARSLAYRDYVIAGHPDFDDYACGVMGSTLTPDWIRKAPEMLRRFPPKPLPDLGAGLIWRAQ